MYSVLLADDEPLILEGLKSIIEWNDYGFQIIGAAADGREAAALLEETGADVLVTDVVMPEKTGLELIRRLNASGSRTRSIVISGYSDFAYVKEAARLGIENYLLKPIDEEELAQTLLELAAKLDAGALSAKIHTEGAEVLRQNTVSRWLAGSIGEPELREKASMLGIEVDAPAYAAAVVRPSASAPGRPEAWSVLSRALERERAGYAVPGAGGEALALFFLAEHAAPLRRSLGSLIERAAGGFRSEAGVEVKIAVGPAVIDPALVERSLEAARRLFSRFLVPGTEGMLYGDEHAEPESEAGPNTSALQTFLEAAMSAGEGGRALERIHRAYEEMSCEKRASPGAVTAVSEAILSAVTAPLRHLEPEESWRLAQGVAGQKTFEDLRRYILQAASRCVDLLKGREAAESPLVRRAREYLRGNFAGNINLKSTAHALGVHRFYLGDRFRRETGEGFTGCLNRMRVERAKELLAADACTVKEAAERCGYWNGSYFSTVFRKYAGVSPSEYRRAAASPTPRGGARR